MKARGYNLAQAKKNAEQEVSPEQAAMVEAENQAEAAYDSGQEIYDRFEEAADEETRAEVQGEMKDIARAMEDAFEGVEDAFGAETECYMFHLNENPWGVIDDPTLTVDQQHAVINYVNAKNALEGVMDASNETADRKREDVKQAIKRRTHKNKDGKDDGMIIPARMKVDDREVYVVKGDGEMYPDGTGIDVHNSSESIIIMDPQTGEYKFTSPDQIAKVDEGISSEDELQKAYDAIDAEQQSIFSDMANVQHKNLDGTSGEVEEKSVTSQHGNGPEQDNDLSHENEWDNSGRSVAADTASGVEDDRDRSDIRVYEEGLGAERDAYSEYSERTRRNSEAERLIGYGNEPGQNNGRSSWTQGADTSLGVASNTTGSVEGDRDRSDIRVYEEGLGASRDEYSEYSERARREAESERLVAIARQHGQYVDKSEYGSLGTKYPKHTGESEVYTNKAEGKVYKIKDPAAKSPMKGGVQPEDAIYEHLVHNKYFPETRYQFEGISDDMGDLRIVLSQEYIHAVDNATDEQIEAALAERGMKPEGRY
ncbi:MAG: hypothetical protein K2F99_01630, partial [Muribaculaceae bacterium]|nr:hypothetical protein [Muribaculaceae bacterium]